MKATNDKLEQKLNQYLVKSLNQVIKLPTVRKRQSKKNKVSP